VGTNNHFGNINMAKEVFISYSRKDLQQVISIRDELKDMLHIDSWIDLKGIESGEQFVNSIIKAIDEAKIVLFMISEVSMQSEYTKKEVMYARNIGKKIIPIVLDNSKLSGWFLFEFGIVDYVDIHNPMQKQKLHENLRSWLGHTDNDEGPLDFFETGIHYYQKQDYQVAFAWFIKAAQFEFPEAQYYIGLCYLQGTGVEKNYSNALEWFHKAAKRHYSQAENSIGLMYKHGTGVVQDDKKALEWYKKAAEHGCIDAQYNIGKCYYYGRGVEIDYEKAASLFEKIAREGYVKAESSIAYCYLTGEGVERDYKKAVMWFEKAAIKGATGAQFHLGYCLYHGLGVEQNYQKAVYWFEQAIKKNHAAAEYHMGLCCYYGYGASKDLAKAKIYFRKAVKQGYEEANKLLEHISVP
jgi:TPR repeat protein